MLFILNNNQTKIEFQKSDKIGDILKKFAEEKKVIKEDYDYCYKSKIINDDNKIISDLIDIKEDIVPIIDVSKKVRIIKCPKCVCNDSILKIENYHLSFSGCKHNHNVEVCFDKYKDSQSIDFSKIICHKINSETQKGEMKDFYKCYECEKDNKYTTYYCDKCSKEHSGVHPYEKKMVTFGKRNCYCFCTGEQLKQFNSYCEECEKDFCENCQKDHQDSKHKIQEYKSLDLHIDDINKNINEIKSKIEQIRIIVRNIKNTLYGSLQLIEKYAEIAEDIMLKYNFNKEYKNYRIVKTIQNLQHSNEEVKKQLNDIIKEWNEKKKIEKLSDIYLNERNWYANTEANINSSFISESDVINQANKAP